MKQATRTMTPAQLNWAVATIYEEDDYLFDPHPYLPDENGEPVYFEPALNWDHGGPALEEQVMSVQAGHPWLATMEGASAFGETPLVAMMRCLVTKYLGEEVDIPEGLE